MMAGFAYIAPDIRGYAMGSYNDIALLNMLIIAYRMNFLIIKQFDELGIMYKGAERKNPFFAVAGRLKSNVNRSFNAPAETGALRYFYFGHTGIVSRWKKAGNCFCGRLK
jgi:hypothetical protein